MDVMYASFSVWCNDVIKLGYLRSKTRHVAWFMFCVCIGANIIERLM